MPGCPARHPLLCARSLRESCSFLDTRRKWAGKQQTQPQKYTRLWSNKVKKIIRPEANVYKQKAHGIYQDASCYTCQILSLINYFLGKQIFYIRIPLNTFRTFTILPRWSLHNDLIFSHIRGDWTGKHKVVKKGWQWGGGGGGSPIGTHPCGTWGYEHKRSLQKRQICMLLFQTKNTPGVNQSAEGGKRTIITWAQKPGGL